ncbi:MAG: peptidylprolyl isomerase [Bryobacteraceae bacterium]|jgi:peptidyl-prolyl cis-trans isomerase C
MPILVNGELIPKELIREEERRLAQLSEWQGLAEGLDKGVRMREAAEQCAIDRVLLRQQADQDTRPIDPALLASQVQHLRTANGCRVVFDDGPLQRQIEGQLRLQRTMHELMGPLPEPTDDEIARFYKAQRRSFQREETIHAAHIVKHVDETHPEEEARAGIEAALAELQRGETFEAVVERHSDCKGNGGDLGSFQRGEMVDEFDNVVFAMKPGECSPIFRSPFGFHIAEVRSRAPAGIPELREVKDIIGRFLMSMLEQDAARRVAEALRARANIRRISTREAEELAHPRVAG